jgi:hypothetical protein
MPRRRRPLTLAEWLIVIAIAGILFALTAPARPGRRSRRIAPAPPAAAPQPAVPVSVPDADKRLASPPSVFGLWQRVQNPLALLLALHVISRALRGDRRKHPKTPAPSKPAPASGPPPRGEDV